MTHTIEEIFAEASELRENDRAALAGMLLHSLEPAPDAGTDDAWEKEIRRRVKALASGEVKEIPWEEARARLWARFGSHR
jgi:putative addiction module component (TIGR02574 family)